MNITARRFRQEDAEAVSDLISQTLRTTNIKDYSKAYIEEVVAQFTPEKVVESILRGRTDRGLRCHRFLLGQ